MHVVKCSCCGEDVTMPKWHTNKPYGYTCYAKLFGKTPAARYIPLKGWVRVFRHWDDHVATMSPDAIQEFAGKSMINFAHPTIKIQKAVGSSDHAIHYNGCWYIPENDMKSFLKGAHRKHVITSEQLQTLLKEI